MSDEILKITISRTEKDGEFKVNVNTHIEKTEVAEAVALCVQELGDLVRKAIGDKQKDVSE